MKKDKQELLNNFYILSKTVNTYKCMRLTKEEIGIIANALSLLEEVDLLAAEKKYNDYLKEKEEFLKNIT